MADTFAERMYKSQRGRYMAGARQKLLVMQQHVEYALEQMDQGEVPSIDFTAQAAPIDQALSQVAAIDELKEAFDTKD